MNIFSFKKTDNLQPVIGKKYQRLIKEINKYTESCSLLSDKEFPLKTAELRSRVQKESLEKLLPEAFALVREAAERTIGLRHYDVQLIGGAVLSQGKIAEMNTGEGKTLASTTAAYLMSLEQKGVHLITANEYLAQRDYELMKKIYDLLDVSVGLNISTSSAEEKRTAYQCDIVYGTGTEFGFDYLRDNLSRNPEEKVQKELNTAIVDEIDSVLIDEARTPLIIADKVSLGADLFRITSKIAEDLKRDTHYIYKSDTKQLNLTDDGIDMIEELFDVENSFDEEHQELLHHIMQSLRAKEMMIRDRDYMIRDQKVHIIDKYTGRVMEGRTFSDGLHQAIEAKENVPITEENTLQATITIQNYFRMYNTLCGMTGSATPSKEEFLETYNLQTEVIPTNRPLIREDHDDLFYRTKKEKMNAIIRRVSEISVSGQPILIGTVTIQQSEELSSLLSRENIKHRVLNAKTAEDEARLISLAGQKHQITIATNMAGRGTDILLGEGIKELGGLYIIGTERHESNRIDMQLRGRAGRQGDPGSSQFIISLEDDLFTLFDEEQLLKYKKKIKEERDGQITSPDPIKFIDTVQKTIESLQQAGRAHLLKLDSVIDQQSKVIYGLRDYLLESDVHQRFELLNDYYSDTVKTLLPEKEDEFNSHRMNQLKSFISDTSFSMELPVFNEDTDIKKTLVLLKEDFIQWVSSEDHERLEEHMTLYSEFLLKTMDAHWIRNLEKINAIKDGILLRSYSQEDPYRQFQNEALELFENLMFRIKRDSVLLLITFIKEVKENKESGGNEE
ncbi:preprotein translocase subunit SecA [Jeotgalibacillus sp. R-1-5s-1]|uniref:preprotein translocase subunit SecA n=1 Tax=Jeotgalibacillus sp. R-1-5s-1 TaxID=2555897 RepID=UPI00106CBD4B|nr:preprotein translocase subunit SecA [Jeotgalibacillus sp. R-1-5s-1]TFD95749.1 preprotein translocase subunit SecA [Jeotgalibacillus sp. R-1-5s-1]